MWTLESSGRFVEKVIYEYTRTLKHESCLHSFIINDADMKAQSIFRKEEWEEIFSSNLKIQHFDINYINHAYRAMHTLWEIHSEPIIKTGRVVPAQRRSKKIGRKGDGIFRLIGDRLEFGAIEAGKKWEGKSGRKYIIDSLKLSKTLRDMFVQLAKECDDDEQIVRKLQTVGMLHSGNRFQLLTLDVPKGYICRIKRFAFQEVASHINNPPLAFVLKNILRAKAIIKQTLVLVQKKRSSYLDDLDDLDYDGKEINRCTTIQTITLSKTHKTPKKNRL
ncbi:8696_t:CDS:2 [Funneliformis mosseae]|uniref:8696_t:CDS:1 n=1 Tax=Funneliformis mosseae TaxID=27381 RepID=A0A9N8WE17_FUNMO|nr:8696_t:CDS:2 [Funneliformis mosseae]